MDTKGTVPIYKRLNRNAIVNLSIVVILAAAIYIHSFFENKFQYSILTQYYSEKETLSRLNTMVNKSLELLLRTLTNEEEDHTPQVLAASEDFQAAFASFYAAAYKRRSLSELSLAREIEPQISALRTEILETVILYRKNKIPEAKKHYFGDLSYRGQHIRQFISDSMLSLNHLIRLKHEEIHNFQKLMMILAAVLVIILIIVTFRQNRKLSKSIVYPLSSLIKATKIIGRGDYSYDFGDIIPIKPDSSPYSSRAKANEIKVRSQDEIYQLAYAFKVMTGKLKESYENLEDKVKERTEALTIINKELEIEISERKRAEKNIKKAHDELDSKVKERTAELSKLNKDLLSEMTVRKRAEDELLKAQKLESVGILAGGIAHDFNNILTSVLSNIALLKMTFSPGDESFKRLSMAEKAALRAQNLTQQLLTFSMGGSPVKKTISVGDLIRESTDFSLLGSNVRCEYSIAEDLWPVKVDEGQINQVISNLVINADQAMPGGGVIKVGAEDINVDADHVLSLNKGRYVKIFIKDEGHGIPEEHLHRIFDPYFTTKQKGSGLGLATTYSIVKKHDGFITVESGPQNGTTFYIYLPASAKEAAVEIASEPIQPGEGRVLLMDDEEGIRESTGDALVHFGYEVDFAKDGAEAIELYEKAIKSGRPFHTVILDLTIPGGMGGKKTLEKLREIDPAVKAIAFSGYFTDPVMSNHREYGFHGIITKPYKIEELIDSLKKPVVPP